jgi:hypothetical protein
MCGEDRRVFYWSGLATIQTSTLPADPGNNPRPHDLQLAVKLPD